VAAIVAFEPGYVFPTGEAPAGQREVPLAEFQKLTQVPILVVIGDFLDKVPNGMARLTNGQAFVQTLNNHGGNAKLIYLPEEGIFGNSHVMMLEENNAEVADLVSQWLNENGLDKH
jgi:hypothetical protein